ncbi:MAG TPA: flavin reductase family protein [Blastocatellia bacterium]|jgi:flavin reductase (DIM6/NTAB) family NADH-FMN oxidoreductase RutF|nr:flavin reductase family protein [Blastocatellia bacterium]
MGVSKEEFRNALGRFASGVTIVTARGTDGRPCGITVSAFSSVSLDPPLVLVCIDKRASLHDCISEGVHFAVNILSEDQELMSRRFASKDEDRFNGTGYRESIQGTPLIDGSLVALECRVVHAYPGGDHTIVVGEVESASVADGKPLAYFRGGYAQLS